MNFRKSLNEFWLKITIFGQFLFLFFFTITKSSLTKLIKKKKTIYSSNLPRDTGYKINGVWSNHLPIILAQSSKVSGAGASLNLLRNQSNSSGTLFIVPASLSLSLSLSIQHSLAYFCYNLSLLLTSNSDLIHHRSLLLVYPSITLFLVYMSNFFIELLFSIDRFLRFC